MRQFVIAPVVAAGLLFSAAPAVFAAEPATTPPTATEAPSDDGKSEASSDEEASRIVCRRERPVGSNRPVKTCRTAAEWKAEREEAARATRGGRGGVRPSGGLGATPAPGL